MNEPRTPPEFASCDINIQWKGTDVCLDFHCSCTPQDQAYEGHIDGCFAQHIECPNCGARYVLPQGFTLRAVNETGFKAPDLWRKPEGDDDA